MSASQSEIERTGQALAEEAWIDVIRRMDEVYTELVTSQETLETKHRELAEAHQFTEGILAAMTDVMVVCDALGYVKQVNRAMTELTGRSETGLIGENLLNLIAYPQQQPQLQQQLPPTQPEVSDLDLNIFCQNGNTVPVTWNISALFDGQHRYSGFVAVGRPMGELKRAYAELKQAHQALQAAQAQLIQAEKMASLGRLVAGVAHELNNPISFVMGNSYAMQRYAQKLQRYLAAVHQQCHDHDLQLLRQQLKIDRLLADLPSLTEGLLEGAQRSSAIVDALKRFSAVETDIQQPVNLAECIQQALHWVVQAMPHRVTVQEVGLAEACWVSGSANQLQQVLVNLIQNAFDAVETVPHPQLELILSQDTDQAVFTLADNGTGIAAADLAKIFDPFFTTKPVGKGTGLGLSISYSIVEKHGGQLTAGNRTEGGAYFSLRLPRLQN